MRSLTLLSRASDWLSPFCFVALLACSSTVIAQAPKKSESLADRLKRLQTSSAEPKAQTTATPAPVTNPTYQKILKSVAFIGCVDDQENAWQGTGWVLDEEQRLIVTNHHVIEGVEECTVYFPLVRDGQLVTDMNETLVSSNAIPGRVVDSDQSVDLAIVQVDRLPKENVALELAERSATPGQRIHSIAGNSLGSQGMWIYSTGFVRQIAVGDLANGHRCMMLESDMATNQGNSGGPVCDDEGHVVAVVEGHSTDARLVSIYVDLSTLTKYLAEAIRFVDPKSAEDLRTAARRHFDDGRVGIAMKLASAAIKKDPKSAEGYALRGWCWFTREDYDSARGDFEEALELNRGLADAHCGLAELANIKENYDDAIKSLTTAIRNEPTETHYLTRRAEIRLEWGNYDEALVDFNAAVKADPESLDAKRGKGITLIRQGNFQEGGDTLADVIDYFDNDAEAVLMLGVALQGLEEQETAAELYAKAIELDPEYGEAYQSMGALLFEAEDFPQAIMFLSKAVEIDEEDANSTYLLGAACAASQDFDSAKIHLERAQQLDPENDVIQSGVKEIMQAIREAERRN